MFPPKIFANWVGPGGLNGSRRQWEQFKMERPMTLSSHWPADLRRQTGRADW